MQLNSFTGIFSKYFADLFIETSSLPLISNPSVLEGFEGFVSLLYKKNNQSVNGIKYLFKHQLNTIQIENSNKLLLAFSGGKDSIAAVHLAKEKGFDIVLYHLAGVNRAYNHELEHAQNIAKELDLPLIVEKCTIKGKLPYKEHPIKNALILSKMVEFGINEGIHQFAFGNHNSYGFDDSTFDTDFSDSIECFEELEKGYQFYINNFKIHSFLKNDRHAFEVLIKYSPNLLSKLSSCLLPPYRKPNVIKANLKFGNVLLPNRCGSCYKCALEYYLACEANVLSVEYNEEYLSKCKRILAQKNVDLS